MSGTLELSQEILSPLSALLAQAGLSASILSGSLCTQGRNNRTYRITTAQGSYIVKQYLRQSNDSRDRLNSEFSFLSYAKPIAPEAVATPLYQNAQEGMALYEYLEGRVLSPEEVTSSEVKQAAQFFCALNEASVKVRASHLPLASEACFSIEDHLTLIEGRIALLQKIKVNQMEDEAASVLVARLIHVFQDLVSELKRGALIRKLDLTAYLDKAQRCISPSDFGFHNALKKQDGRLSFVDFEYAGWDDPAKMTGDFFSQLALPVPSDLFESFVQEVMQPFERSEELIYRAHCLRLLYRVKWCCIALNIFLPTHLARYRFANPTLDVRDFKKKQLAKAENLIHSLESCKHGIH